MWGLYRKCGEALLKRKRAKTFRLSQSFLYFFLFLIIGPAGRWRALPGRASEIALHRDGFPNQSCLGFLTGVDGESSIKHNLGLWTPSPKCARFLWVFLKENILYSLDLSFVLQRSRLCSDNARILMVFGQCSWGGGGGGDGTLSCIDG